MSSRNPSHVVPTSPFPLLPLRNGVLFPGTVITLPLGRKQSVELSKAVRQGDIIGVAVQRDPKEIDPTIANLMPMGTFARVHEVFRSPQGLQIGRAHV